MAIDIVRGTTNKPVATQALEQRMAELGNRSGELFIGYPIIVSPTGSYSIDALLVSIDTGIVVFDLVEGTDPGDYQDRQDELYNQLESRLKKHSDLVDRRKLRIPIHPISFAPAITSADSYDDNNYPLADANTLLYRLPKCDPAVTASVYRAALSVIESTSTIRKNRSRRAVQIDNSRGAKLKRLEDSIATLDSIQNKAVIETVEGVQRIRGLAGSGKTIVLALKAAYLHIQNPNWRIAVTFNTRSLKGFFRRLITISCLEQNGQEPDWENLRIVDAWGAPGKPERDGMYYEFCRVNNVTYFDFRSARSRFGADDPFAGACKFAIGQAGVTRQIYDVILTDEAQDFSPAFLKLCYESLRTPKRLIYAYDELQNLTGGSLPSPEAIFGDDSDGSSRVRFESESNGTMRNDIILEKCYRNSRPVLVAAHALGFGIYRKPAAGNKIGLVQMFDHPQLWEEIGYTSHAGNLYPGSNVILSRSETNSPRFLESHSSIEDLISFKVFDTKDDQTNWLVQQIEDNVTKDELRHDDIIVINPDPLSTRTEVGPIRRRLLEAGIECHVAGVDTDPDYFNHAENQSITFTGIHRAKGNEAGMVYIINAQDCHTSAYNLARLRNRLFTAITRSKAWIRVLGIGTNMRSLIDEYEMLKSSDFELRFRYPTEDEREQLRIVHKDMSEKALAHLRKRDRTLSDLVSDLEAGDVNVQDLNKDLVEKLLQHFENID